jgi:hypothetical protein
MRKTFSHKNAGMAVIERALAKALPHVVMAQSTAARSNANLVLELDAIVAALQELQLRVTHMRQGVDAPGDSTRA